MSRSSHEASAAMNFGSFCVYSLAGGRPDPACAARLLHFPGLDGIDPMGAEALSVSLFDSVDLREPVVVNGTEPPSFSCLCLRLSRMTRLL